MAQNKFPYVARGNQRYFPLMSQIFNIDSGSSSHVYDVLGNFPFDVYVISAYPIYTEATDTTGAANANCSLGIAAGGTTIVAATALEAAKSIGDKGTAGTVVAALLPAGSTLVATHNGIATTEAGQYRLQVLVLAKP